MDLLLGKPNMKTLLTIYLHGFSDGTFSDSVQIDPLMDKEQLIRAAQILQKTKEAVDVLIDSKNKQPEYSLEIPETPNLGIRI